MSDFMKALEKTDPEILTPSKKEEVGQQMNSMSFQDMKDYFEAMKENLMNSMKKDMDEYMKQMNQKQEQEQPAPEQKEKEGTENASSSDL